MFWKPIYLDKFLFMFFFKFIKTWLNGTLNDICLLVWSSIVSKFKMQFSIALHRYSSPSFIHLHTGKNKKKQSNDYHD